MRQPIKGRHEHHVSKQLANASSVRRGSLEPAVVEQGLGTGVSTSLKCWGLLDRKVGLTVTE